MNYGEAVRARVATARFRGELESESVRFEASNPVCGDVVRIALNISGGKIREARWKASGCPPTLAASDVLAEMIVGLTVKEAQAIASEDVVATLPGLPRTSFHAAEVAVEALRGALQALD
ncbi:MAG: iron-sulfur cluster assembly scaffold protein [Candidatus Hydrogenedentota bacterium]